MSALPSTTKVPREFATSGDDLEAAAAKGRSLWAAIEGEVRTSKASVAVLSAEYLFGLRTPQVEELRDLVSGLFSPVEIVCYVRDPADYYLAMVQQALKASHTFVPPGQLLLRARGRLTRFQAAFDGRVSVRSAQRSDLIDGDIVSDFVQRHLPVAAASVTATGGDLNTSMSAEAMCIMQDLRRHAWPDQDGQFAFESTRIWRLLQEVRDTVPQTPARLRPDIRDAILRAHERDLEFLEAQFAVRLPRADSSGSPPPVPVGWDATDVREVIVVDPDEVERVRASLLRLLAVRPRARARWRR
jgi:hypothetical protein